MAQGRLEQRYLNRYRIMIVSFEQDGAVGNDLGTS